MSTTLEITTPRSGRLFFESASNVHARTHFGIEKALWLSAKDIQEEFNKQVLAKNKTGRLYLIRHKKDGTLLKNPRKHRASAAGETPANITGNYRKSFGFKVNQGLNPELVIGNSAEYAGFLELGTRRMKPRPGLLNSINARQRDIMRNLTTEILQEI